MSNQHDVCKALYVTRDAEGNIVSVVNLWHEQKRVRKLEQDVRFKSQLKIVKSKVRK